MLLSRNRFVVNFLIIGLYRYADIFLRLFCKHIVVFFHYISTYCLCNFTEIFFDHVDEKLYGFMLHFMVGWLNFVFILRVPFTLREMAKIIKSYQNYKKSIFFFKIFQVLLLMQQFMKNRFKK